MGKAKLTMEKLLARQRSSWQSGKPVRVEEIVRRFPALKNRDDAVVDLVYAEVLLREEKGESPQRSDYTALFPMLKEKIDRQFQVHEALDVPATPQSQIATSVGGETIPSSGIRALGKQSIPGFDLLEVVGRGGSGIAYKALDEKLNRTVVIKFLLATGDDLAAKKLLHEASASASLMHPSIVQIYHVGVSNDNPYMVMEYADGGSLAQKLQHGPLSSDEAVAIGRQVADAVEYAHSKSIIHRDLKPGNILLESNGVPQVADFGLARKVGGESLHATGDVLGTPAYMSPEQAKGQPADARSDVYSIGAILYEMLCGRSPFDAATPWDILHQVTTTDPVALRQLNSSIPKDLETICQKCLEKDPARRYQSAKLLAEDLARFEKGEPIVARPVNLLQRTVKWCQRNPWLAGLATVSFGLLLALAGGSTYAALKLSAANKAIKREQELAQKAQGLAEKDRKLAVESLWQLVNTLYEDLSSDAATIKTREKVVNAAIEGLESISQFKGTKKFDQTAGLAHRRIADLHALRGNNDAALREHQISVEIARDILAGNPGDPDSKLDLVRALDALSAFHIGLMNHDEVAKAKTEFQQILGELRQQHPENKVVFKHAVAAYSRELDYIWANRPTAEAFELGEIAAADCARLIELDPNDESAYMAGYHIHSRLGRARIESGDLPGAESHWSKSRSLIEHVLELQPDNPDYIYGYAVQYRMESTALLARGKSADSIASLNLSLDYFRGLSETDAENIRWKQNIANCLVMRSQTQTAMGRIEEAIDGYEKAAVIHLSNAEKTGMTNLMRSLMAQVRIEQSMLYLRKRNWSQAKQSAQEVGIYVNGVGDEIPLKSNAASHAQEVATVTAEVSDFMMGEGSMISSADSELCTLFMIGCVEAESNSAAELSQQTQDLIGQVNPDLSCESFDELVNYIETPGAKCTNPIIRTSVPLFQTRMLSIRGKHLESASELSEQQRNSRQRQLAEKIDTILVSAAQSNPQVIQAMRVECELSWFIESETFANSTLNQ